MSAPTTRSPESPGGFARASRLARNLRPGVVTWVLVAYSVLLCGAVWTYAVLHTASDYRTTLEAQRRHLQSVSAGLTAHIQAMLGNGVGASQAAVNELRAAGKVADASDAQVADTLGRMLTGGAYVRGLFLATTSRFVSVDRDGRRTTQATAPAWLMSALSASSADSWVGDPLEDPERPLQSIVPVAVHINLSGARDTWAGAYFDFGSLADVYRQPDSESGVSLWRSDGVALAFAAWPEFRSRVALEVGRSIATSAIYRDAIQGPPSGIIEGTNPYNGKATLTAYDRVRGYPLYVAANRQRWAFLADWSVQRRDTWVLATAITILVAMTTLFLDHFLRVLRLREQHYRTLFNNVGFSAFVLQDSRFIEANRTSASMFGVSDANRLLGLTPWDLSPPRQPNGRPSDERAGERIREALVKGSTSFEWLHKRLSDGQPFHATVDISSLQIGNTTLSLAVVHDVTQRKLAELERERLVQELQELAGTLVHIQDDEPAHRTRAARCHRSDACGARAQIGAPRSGTRAVVASSAGAPRRLRPARASVLDGHPDGLVPAAPTSAR